MNAVLLAVLIMLILSIARVHVIISLLIGAISGGLVSGLSLADTLQAFEKGITGGASIALSYALLGAFAVAISRSGMPLVLTHMAIRQLTHTHAHVRLKWLLIISILLISISSQNIIPIHIAFIPLLIPPLIYVMNQLQLDRRLLACVMVFGLITPYMFLPIGFGNVFLVEILLKNISESGLDTSNINVMYAMAIPAAGMLLGLLVAIFVSYRRPRTYVVSEANAKSENDINDTAVILKKKPIVISLIALVGAFVVQLYTSSMILGALVGFLVFMGCGSVKWGDADDVFSEGIKMMASIGFIMITAQGFAEVLRQTGQIESLVYAGAELFHGNKVIASFAMMLVGLIITLGIGSSFSTVPIIAAIYVPLCIDLGFSPIATVCLVGAAGAIGDAGSPASDSTLAVTGGLNTDGMHNHMRDTVIPTFIHYNIPLFLAGWAASLIL